MIFLLIIWVLLTSCSVKVAQRCADEKRVIAEYTLNHVPREFRIYGHFKYGPVKFPMIIAKYDGFYTVKVAKVKDVSIRRDRICARGKCYLLPLLPEDIIFGKVLSGTEYSFCRGGRTVFRERMGVYDKIVVFEGGKLRELIIVNRKNGRGLKITFGSRSERGYFREIGFEMNGEKVKLEIEEVEV